MTDVPDTMHLIKRGDRYYYRRRVPAHLRTVIGRLFIQRGLGVTTIAEARKLRAIEEVRTNALFEAAENGLVGHGDGTAAKPVSPALLEAYVRERVAEIDKARQDNHLHHGPETLSQQREAIHEVESDLLVLTDPGDPNAAITVQSTAAKIAKAKGLDLDAANFPLASFFDLLRRGLIEADRRHLDRLKGDHSKPYHDYQFGPHASPPAMNFGELCDAFLTETFEEYAANNVSQKRADSVRSRVALLREIMGADTVVHEIDDDRVRAARVMLSKVPNNRVQVYPKLGLAKAIERAEKDGKPTFAAPTQEFHLNLLRAILRLGVRKKLLSGNPAEGIKPLTKDKLTAGQKRRPLSAPQLYGFFRGGFYRSCQKGSSGPYTGKDRDWRFWLPLIMLFSGARPNEVCGLTVDDFGQTKAGTPYFAVTDEGEGGKTLKTEASRRRVPIHPELIKIGLLSFVEKRRKASGNGARLFPALKPNKYGNVAWYAVKRFNETFIPAEITLEDRQSLYSLRHNVRDALRRIKADAATLLHVTGWSPAGKAVSDAYGDAGDPDHYADAVAKIAYPDLDLSFLHEH